MREGERGCVLRQSGVDMTSQLCEGKVLYKLSRFCLLLDDLVTGVTTCLILHSLVSVALACLLARLLCQSHKDIDKKLTEAVGKWTVFYCPLVIPLSARTTVIEILWNWLEIANKSCPINLVFEYINVSETVKKIYILFEIIGSCKHILYEFQKSCQHFVSALWLPFIVL